MSGREAERLLYEKLRQSKKYRDICDETLVDLLQKEEGKGRRPKELETAVREKLHRIAALYLETPFDDELFEKLEAAFAIGDDAVIRGLCLEILGSHASTKERLPQLTEAYARIFQHPEEVKVVLDVASAFNPFSFRWMRLSRGVRYHALDINRRTIGLINRYFRLEGLPELGEVADVIASPPTIEADVALFLKTYHCLEARERGAALRVVEALQARRVVVSFPTRNLTGRSRDISGNYLPRLLEVASARGWATYDFATVDEAFVVITKS